jgi:O-antigen/teichoic acid export membrane protein
LSNKHERTKKAGKNIIASFLIKGISIFIGFILVPMTLNYLDQTRYGIWITISSFLTWFTFFEIGLGSGLKNKLAEALAVKDYETGRIYVSTTYAILSIIMGIVAIIFFIGNRYIDWTVVLNTDKDLATDLMALSYIVFGFFFLRFVVKLVGIVLIADQRPAVNNLFGPLGNLIALIVIYILTKTTEGSLVYLGLTLSVSPVLVLIVASIYFYNTDYKNIAPSLSFVQFKYARNLLSLGVKFFVIQVAALVLFQSGNIIITQFFGPAQVTPYNIAYKYFSILSMGFSIIMMPFWAAHTEAWVKKDIAWINSTVKNLLKIWALVVLAGIGLYFASNMFFNLWIGKEEMKDIHISEALKILIVIYFALFNFGSIYNMFINGVGKLRVQMWSLTIGAILFIPLSILFIKVFHWGIESVVVATIVSNFYSPFIAPLQYKKIIKGKAHGIWNK